MDVESITELPLQGLLGPAVILISATLATLMATITIQNNKRSEVLKNTLSAIENDLFIGESRSELEKACQILNQKMEGEHSFKALVRLRPNATRFVSEFKETNQSEYNKIVDALSFADRLCYGVEAGLYDKSMADRFLGSYVFKTWWAGMVLIREKELEYLDGLKKNPRREPDFGSPYGHLFEWIRSVAKEQSLENVDFVLARLHTGYSARREFRRLEATMQE